VSFLRIGHRGAAGTRPEHTRASFERALELGVDMIELDVQLTRDGALVVLHDLELGRTLPGSGPVRTYPLEELRRLDAGGWFDPAFGGERVLTLGDVFELVGTHAALNVEIKSPESDWEETASRLVRVLRERGRMGDTIVSCFAPGALDRVRAFDADVRLGVLWQKPQREALWRTAGDLGAVSVHPYWALAGEGLVREAHQRGYAVHVWTVNEAEAITRLGACGVDGIISDFPERLRC